jgi:hypothetical protein
VPPKTFVHRLFTAEPQAFSSGSRHSGDTADVGDFLSVIGIVISVVALLALVRGLDRI